MIKGIGKELLLLLLFFGAIWVIVSYYSEDEVETWDIIPEDILNELGEIVLDDIDRGTSLELVANDTFSLSQWNEILDRLEFKNSGCNGIYLTNNPEINAYTLPGDNIVIYSGLIEFLDSGEQLAAVLAHELGHVNHEHVKEMLAERFAVTTLMLIVSGDAGGNVLLELSDVLFTASFSRDNEREADEYGLKLLEEGNLPTDAMLRFFEKLEEEQTEVPELLAPFSSHPLNNERIEFVRKYSDKLSDTKLLNFDWTTFQEEMLLLAGHSYK